MFSNIFFKMSTFTKTKISSKLMMIFKFVFDHTKSPKIYYQNQPSLKGESKIFVNNADQSKACYVFKSLPWLAVDSDG